MFLGMLAGNAVGAALCVLARVLAHFVNRFDDFIVYPSLLLIPFAIGLVAAWVWKPLKLQRGDIVLLSVLCTLLGLGGAWVVFHEGIVCLIMVSPILYAGVLAGALAGRAWFSRKNDTLNFCLAPLAMLAIAAEPMLRSPHTGVVTDEIQIAAPPARVWPHVLAFSEIPDAPDYWLFRLGLPYPTATTNGGDFVGASRACQFSGGAVFEEVIAEFVPTQRLTFDIVKSPPDPELLGHLDARRGQFELRDNGDGTTTLIGRTWYSLQIRPTGYFDWWTHDVFRAVHLRVMNNVKRLAENGA